MKENNINIKKGGYVLPIAIGVLVVASIGLIVSSWWGNANSKKLVPNEKPRVNNVVSVKSTANDDATLDNDTAAIEAQIKNLDNDGASIDAGLNDSPASLQ